MADNWYIILELEFDPTPVHDEAVIEKAIDEKAKFWSKNFNDFKRGPEYRRHHDNIKTMRKEMIGEQNIRDQHIKDACAVTFAPIDKFLKMMGRRGEITRDEVQSLATKQKVSVEIVERRAAACGVKIGAGKSADFQATYDKYYKNKPPQTAVFDGMKPLLDSFGTDSLYGFLGVDKTLPRYDLLNEATKKKKTFVKADATSSNGSKLCGQCELAFKDDTSKAAYDTYLEWVKRKSILDEAKELYAISKRLSKEDGNEAISKLTAILKDISAAQDLFVAFCEVEGVVYTPLVDPAPGQKPVVCIFCGFINDVSTGREVCGNCKEKLKCPSCNTLIESNVKVCKCAFEFENIKISNALCKLAQNDIRAMDFSAVEVHLSDAEKLWAENEKIAPLRQRLSELKGRIGEKPEEMRSAAKAGNFNEARKLYDEIKKLFPEFNEPELETEIQGALDAAMEALNQAKAAKSEKEIIDYCDKAYEICKDFPGIKEVISKFPPHPPTGLNVVVDGVSKANILSWDKSASEGMVHYSIVRKKDIAPISISDGETLGRVSSCEYSDTQIEAAVNYFYAVFSERAGIQSKPLVNDSPVVNYFEVSNLTVITGDSTIELKWSTLPNGATAEIYRKKGATKEEKIHSTTAISHLDSGLENDASYTYVVKLVYSVDGRKHTTNGVTIGGIPTQPPKPIGDLFIKPGEGDTFTAEWSNPDNSDVELYCSTKKPEYAFGDVVPQQIIEGEMSKLALNRTSVTSATFQHKGDELLYIVAAVIKSGSVALGATARASRDEAVKIQSVNVMNGKIHIFLEHIPKDATGFVVLHRFDRYPTDISEMGIARKYVTVKNYEHNNALIIDNVEPKHYFFSVFAQFDRDGERDYSIGSNYSLNNAAKETITYSIKIVKKLFKPHLIVFNFEAENPSFFLPDIEILSAVSTAPMFRDSAKHFYSITAQNVNGSVPIEIPYPKGIQRDLYIKPFLKDESQASMYQLKLKLGSNLKIS